MDIERRDRYPHTGKNGDGKACVLKIRSLLLKQSFFWNVAYREAHIRKVMGPREDVLDATGIKRTLHTTQPGHVKV